MTDVVDDKLWMKFATNVRAYKIIDFPRYDDKGQPIGKICIRTLLQKEMTQLDLAIAEEVDYLFTTDRKLWDASSVIMVERYAVREANIRANHYLQKIIVHSDNKEKLLFPTPDHVAGAFSVREAAKVLLDYEKLQEGRPILTNLSVDQFNKWIDLLMNSIKKDQTSFLERLAPETLIEFLIYSVAVQSNLSHANSSLLKQVEEFTNNGNTDSNLPPTP